MRIIGPHTGRGSRAAPGLLLAVALSLGGCASDDRYDAIYDYAGELYASVAGEGSDQQPKQLTRQQIGVIPFSVVGLRVDGSPYSYLVAVGGNDELINYYAQPGISLTISGAVIVATRGIGPELLSVEMEPSDPIARPAPLTRWPPSVLRTYSYFHRSEVQSAAVVCHWRTGAMEQVEIVEVVLPLMRVDEVCAGPGRRFDNVYWADPASGVILRSEQWTGPTAPKLLVDVLKPAVRGPANSAEAN